MNSALLRRCAHDIRVTRPWRRALGSGKWGAHAAFAATLLARHGRGTATLFGPERLMRRHRAHTATVHHHHEGDTTRLALRFDIRLSPVTRTRPRSAPFLPWTTAADTDVAPPARAAAHAALVQRIVARERRVQTSTTMREVLREAMAPTPARTAAQTLSSPSRARPVDMVARRPRLPAEDVARPPPAVAGRPEKDTWSAPPAILHPASGAAPPPLSAAELGRVTDHVVRAIDRRFVAQRERRGRI